MEKMKATVFRGANDIRVEEVERPHAGVGEAVIRITLTTICGTDLAHPPWRISSEVRTHHWA
jgi:threonine dehydrogenase-like Zn-dependent dehydrogenase